MSQVFGDPKRLVNDYMAGSHAIGIMRGKEIALTSQRTPACQSLAAGVHSACTKLHRRQASRRRCSQRPHYSVIWKGMPQSLLLTLKTVAFLTEPILIPRPKLPSHIIVKPNRLSVRRVNTDRKGADLTSKKQAAKRQSLA